MVVLHCHLEWTKLESVDEVIFIGVSFEVILIDGAIYKVRILEQIPPCIEKDIGICE